MNRFTTFVDCRHRLTMDGTRSRGVQMILLRRQFLQFTGAAVAVAVVSCVATAQGYPTRPITMIIPFPAGGPLDSVGRVLVERMRPSLGQPIVIENVSGAEGSIGTGRAARAQPDGYTISLGAMATHVMNGAFYSLQYDVLNDFAAVTPLVRFPFFLFARRTMPPKDLNELIAWLKANPNTASLAFTNTGTRLLGTFLQKETVTQFTLVPYLARPSRTWWPGTSIFCCSHQIRCR